MPNTGVAENGSNRAMAVLLTGLSTLVPMRDAAGSAVCEDVGRAARTQILLVDLEIGFIAERIDDGPGRQIDLRGCRTERAASAPTPLPVKLESSSSTKKVRSMPRVTIKTGFPTADGRKETLTEYLCDWPGCPNVAVHVLGCIPDIGVMAVVSDEHLPGRQRQTTR